MATVLKCVSSYNHYGIRHTVINNNMIEENCPRCNEIEMWEHVIKYTETMKIRKEFVTELLKEMFENKDREVDVNEIFEMIEDILRYLEEEEGEYKTNQAIMGI